MNNSTLKTFLLFSLSGLIAISLGVYFRLYPLFYHTSADASEKATLIVLGNLRKTVSQQVQQNYPELPVPQKIALSKKNFDELLHREGQKIRQTIERLSLTMNKHTADSVPYLLESDSFDYYNLTENILKTGKMSDHIKGSKYFNKLMMAPLGYYEPINLLPYVGCAVYKTAQIFSPGIALMYAVGFSSIVITVLSIIFFILVCHHLRCNPVVTLSAAIFFLLAPIFIKRSCFGWYDNDPYNILFPLAILWFFFKGMDLEKPFRLRLVFFSLTVLSITLYAFFWQGWVYFFSLLLMSLGLLIVLEQFILKEHKKSKTDAKVFIGILICSFLGIALTFGFEDFFVLFREGWKALKEFMTPPLSLWPDMYVSVGELRKATWNEIFEFTGHPIFFGIAALGLITSCIQAVRNYDRNRASSTIFIGLFFLSSLILTLGAQRFALLFVVPLSLFFAVGLQFIYDEISHRLQERFHQLKKEPWRLRLALAVVFLSLTTFPILNAKDNTLSLLNRIYNETWNAVLTKIKDETPQESIVNTWWPPGHFIKAMANRAVTFDGATINKPQAYWMANVFLTDNEREALGILRMLNGSANLATDYLQSQGFDLALSIDVLRKILLLNKKDAAWELRKMLRPEQIEALLKLTHAAPRPSYLLVYNELIEKSLVLSFVDRWNFKKIEDISRNPNARQLIAPRKSPEYIKFLWDIAGGPLNYSDSLGQLAESQNRLLFDQGLQIDLETMNCRIDSLKYGHGIPKGIVYLENNHVQRKKFSQPNLPYWVVLYPDGPHNSAMLMDERLAFSILTRLYFFEGKDLNYFSIFTHESDLTKRTNIYVFKVNWDEFLKDLGEN